MKYLTNKRLICRLLLALLLVSIRQIEAAVIRRIFEQYLAGDSLAKRSSCLPRFGSYAPVGTRNSEACPPHNSKGFLVLVREGEMV